MKLAPDAFLRYAHEGMHFPIGTDLVLREEADPEAILRDGERLGRTMERAADRYRSPLGLPVMDLQTEKAELLVNWFGFEEEASHSAHLDAVPSDAILDDVRKGGRPLTPRLAANVDAIRTVAQGGRKVPVGMTIGPFSLTTKLLASPIEPTFMLGMGMDAEDDEEIALLLRALELSEAVIERSLRAQIAAGAEAIFIAEPAANVAYLSPKQIEEGSPAFDRLVTEPNRRVADLLDAHGVQRIFHCCGEIIDPILARFCELKPKVLSLGSSRSLPDDAAKVPEDIVLYGNLPSKKFYSDDLVSVQEVREQCRELDDTMRRTGHPYLLGTECDVLSVPGCERTIMDKVMAIVSLSGTR